MNAKHDLREEVMNLDPRFALVRLLISLLPPLVGNRLRTNLLRMSGVKIGSGSTVGGMIFVHGGGRPASKISIGQHCWINDSCTFDASAEIAIGDNAAALVADRFDAAKNSARIVDVLVDVMKPATPRTS